MPTYKIRGIDVEFPFEAYDCQLVYMEKVIQSLQNKCNALLESPTGTGKTLCLLCATLAWRKSLGSFSTLGSQVNNQISGSQSSVNSSQSGDSKLPTILYTSRTHSQLRQVIQELKTSNYRPKMVILGSREQLCIHREVSLLRGSAQNNACRFLCKKGTNRRCNHHSRVADYMKNNPHLGDEPIDIEDLVNIGQTFGPCPYFMTRELQKTVDIVFAPYNYLIDPWFRKGLGVEWKNSILIFDEAHNLEGLCADAASFDLSSGLLTACISEAKNCIDISSTRRGQSSDETLNPDNFAILRALLLKLEKRIAEVPINSKELGFTKPGPYIYELLADLNITQETAYKLIDIVEVAAELLQEDKLQNKKSTTACRIESISNILKIIFRDKGTAHSAYYRVHVREADANAADVLKDYHSSVMMIPYLHCFESAGKASRTLSWWCFNPGIAMQEFSRLEVGSIILTSGTLSPMDSFAQELKLNFPLRVENPHVITSKQIWAGIVPVGPSGYLLNSSYRNRDSIEYKQELGNTIDATFDMHKGVIDPFGAKKVLAQLLLIRQSSLFPLAIEDYMAKLKDTSTSGAVFFAVCRGKVSEGLDFADHAGRAVVITGMPFATMTDPKVRLKREYLDLQAQSQGGEYKETKLSFLSGEDWYNQQASRAVNQAVGRVIRHRHDYGAIIFCDERFAHPSRKSQISLWIQPHIQCYSKFGDVVYTLTRFFREERICGSTNLKLIKTEVSAAYGKFNCIGDVRELKPVDLLDKISLEETPAVDQACYSLHEVKNRNTSSHSGEIVPANRSSLSPYKGIWASELKNSSDLIQFEKKLLLSGRKSIQYRDHEFIDLTSNSSLHAKPRKEELIAPCSTKKRKVLISESDQMQCVKKISEIASDAESSQPSSFIPITNKVKHEKPQISDSGSRIIAQGSAPSKVDGTTYRIEAEIQSEKSKGSHSSAPPCGGEETKGSAFLIQVQEKLSATEYKEFVGFMKAMKSKAMKISHVLQSIAKLFAGPERLPLLRRFKDYVPAKYHPLYEQYLMNNS
ncbi:Regulator of telomere elongation helicase 1-like [Citrus sinensis]|nr:Regulator of telomere elongation helicase 1-like [Citrus sinensis]